MKKVIETSIRRRVTVAMFTLAILLFGLVSFSRLKVNLLPDLAYPTLTIRTEYTGAAPAEIENLISKPVEEMVGVVKNVQKISSISRSGQSDVILEFAWGTNMDQSIMEVREKLDALLLPLDIQRPIILRFDPTLDPIIRFGLFFKKEKEGAQTQVSFNEEELKYLRRFADEQIKKELESALGVAAVKIIGGLEDEIQILIDQQKLAQLNIPIDTITNIIGAENINLSGGRLEEGTRQYLVRTLNQFRSIEEIGNVILKYDSNTPIYLKDVANVIHGYRERQAITRLNGEEAVEIAIYKEGDANTVKAAEEVDKQLRRVRRILPKNMALVEVYDQSVFIEQAVNEVLVAALLGGFLAVVILYFFLRNFWTTVIIALSIPISVIATFNLMYSSSLSLNIMSLGGIALGIGMLLDNSIVVLENISRHREKGMNKKEASLQGASEVGTAVTASTLTTIAVFFPLVFVKGIAGQLFRDQALTITFSLLVSLIVALTLIPMLASTDFKKEKSRELSKRAYFSKLLAFFIRQIIKLLRGIAKLTQVLISPLSKGFSFLYTRVEAIYPNWLTWALNRRITVLASAFVCLAMSMMVLPQLGVELIPQLSQGEFRIEFLLPPGTPLQKTDFTISQFQNSIKNDPRVRTSFAVAGTGNRLDANPEQGGENWGEISVTMQRGSKRTDEEQVMSDIRQSLENQAGLQYKFYRPTLFTFKTPVEVEISGYNLDKLKDISSQLALKMQYSDRFADVKSSMEIGHPEIQIRFDRERAASLGLNVYQMADRVVNKVRGKVATKYSFHDRKIDVLVRSKEEDRSSIDDIRQLIVNPESKHPVTLSAIAEIQVGIGPGEIRRINQERVALVTANLKYGDLGSAAEEIDEIINLIKVPRDLVPRISGQSKEMEVSFKSLRFALLLAIFLVYLVMASQFESLIHPLVIIFSIPLAMIGAVLALWLTGSQISVVVLLGAILLAGIVVNNAIVLIDRINQLRARGMEKMSAIVEAGKSRLRPIIMTMLTTTLGLLPMAIGLGEGAEMRAPMAITVIGGLTVSTLLTLVVIPVIYSLLDRK